MSSGPHKPDTFLDLLSTHCNELHRVVAAEYRHTICHLEEKVKVLSTENSRIFQHLEQLQEFHQRGSAESLDLLPEICSPELTPLRKNSKHSTTQSADLGGDTEKALHKVRGSQQRKYFRQGSSVRRMSRNKGSDPLRSSDGQAGIDPPTALGSTATILSEVSANQEPTPRPSSDGSACHVVKDAAVGEMGATGSRAGASTTTKGAKTESKIVKMNSQASVHAMMEMPANLHLSPSKVVPYESDLDEHQSEKPPSKVGEDSSEDGSHFVFSVSEVWAQMLTKRKKQVGRRSTLHWVIGNLRGSGAARLSARSGNRRSLLSGGGFMAVTPSASVGSCCYAVEPTLASNCWNHISYYIAANVMMEPNSPIHLFWEVLSFFMIIYDLVTVPLEAFDPPAVSFTNAMLWVVRVFWTIDIFANFLTGYLDDMGRTVLLPTYVARRYAIKQLHLDLLVVGSDWAEQATGVRATGALKSWRMLRILRLLRIKKARDIIGMLSEHVHIRSERLVVVASILKMLILLVTLSHLIGCGMYLVRTLDSREEEDNTEWLATDSALSYRYMQSFHFAIGLFFGEQVLVLKTFVQRLFTSLCLTLTFTLQIWFVSFITTAMTHFEIISTERSSKFASLNRFMTDHVVPREVALKVERNAKHALIEQERNAPESSVVLLQLISDPLMQELHFEMHIPTLRQHPFLRLYCDIDPAGIRKICHTAIQEFQVAKHDVIFVEGESPYHCVLGARMLFIVAGELIYLRQDELYNPHIVSKNHWLSEAPLWTSDWIHCGTLRAAVDSRLLALDVQKFQEIARECPQPQPGSYAMNFVQNLNRISQNDDTLFPHTDIGEYNHDMAELLYAVFADDFSAVRHEFDSKYGVVSKGNFKGDSRETSSHERLSCEA